MEQAYGGKAGEEADCAREHDEPPVMRAGEAGKYPQHDPQFRLQ
jgi:hypothetical protein